MTRINTVPGDDAMHHNDSSSATTTPLDVIVRSLRRRLWRAFRNENGAAALAIYQATQWDWEKWVYEEEYAVATAAADTAAAACEQQTHGTPSHHNALPHRRGGSRRSLFSKKDGSSSNRQVMVPAGDSSSQRCLTRGREDASESSLLYHQNIAYSFKSSADHTIALLQHYMNPSNPFDADDFLDPHTDPYLDSTMNIATSAGSGTGRLNGNGSSSVNNGSNNSLNHSKNNKHHHRSSFRSGRQAFSILFGRHALSSSSSSTANHPDLYSNNSNKNHHYNYRHGNSSKSLRDDPSGSSDLNSPSASFEIQNSHKMTTPLHEAARLGHGD